MVKTGQILSKIEDLTILSDIVIKLPGIYRPLFIVNQLVMLCGFLHVFSGVNVHKYLCLLSCKELSSTWLWGWMWFLCYKQISMLINAHNTLIKSKVSQRCAICDSLEVHTNEHSIAYKNEFPYIKWYSRTPETSLIVESSPCRNLVMDFLVT